MKSLRLGLRPMPLVLVCGLAVLLLAASARAEKVPKPAEGKEAPPVNRTGEAEWGGKWYPVQVLEEKDGKFHVHYNTYSDSSNEWVAKDRIRFPAKAKVAAKAKAEVLWNGTWYAAEVLETKDGKFSIHYTGYGDNWNEWVGQDRIRLLPRPTPKPGDRKDQDEKQPNGQN